MVKLNVCRVSRAAPGLRPRSAVTSDRCQTLPSCRRTALLPSNPPPPQQWRAEESDRTAVAHTLAASLMSRMALIGPQCPHL